MRAVCEACARPQPVDWTPGDLCIHCGEAVRRDVRCFWCVKWTPEAKFCRSCGAAVVDPRDFGAARMLKDAGADRFSIPKLLRELDPDQIENFRRIYQSHAAAVERRANVLRGIEERLYQKNWSARFEESMIPLLPLGESALEALSHPGELENDLAALADTLDGGEAALRRARALLIHPDEDMRLESAMTLSHWRVLARWGAGDRRSILEELRRAGPDAAIAVRLAQLAGEAVEHARLALDHRDPEIAVQAALALGDIHRLAGRASSPDPLVRFAVGDRLADLGAVDPLVRIIPSLEPEFQAAILRTLYHKKRAAPSLRSTLFEIAGAAQDRETRTYSCLVLCLGCPPHEAIQVARASGGDSHVYQALLQQAQLPPDALEAFGGFLIREGRFRMHQYGMTDAAAPGRMPVSFVPRHFEEADDETRIEMIRFAETQLENAADESLHRFLVRLKFDARVSPRVHDAVWSSLHRWYYRIEVGNMGPMILGRDAAERFFDSLPAFLDALANFLGRHDSLAELFVRDPLTRFLRYRDNGFAEDAARFPGEARRLIAALAAACANAQLDLGLRLECVALLGKLPETESSLRALLGSDLDHAAKIALGLASY